MFMIIINESTETERKEKFNQNIFHTYVTEKENRIVNLIGINYFIVSSQRYYSVSHLFCDNQFKAMRE